VTAFEPRLITDAKRLVRGEHYRLAITLAKSRSVDRRELRVLMVPGRAAHEEIAAVRAIAPRARIVAVDRDPVALDVARDAGADACIEADLLPGKGNRWEGGLAALEFDVANIDLCCGATSDFRRIIMAASRRVTLGGSVIGWFSYGRDAVEAYVAIARGGDVLDGPDTPSREEALAGRIKYLSSEDRQIKSILAYRGHSMPMCSVLWRKETRWSSPPAPLWVRDEDLRLVVYADHGPDVDAAALYGVPAARIAAWRAVATRQRSPR
jgi:hypothetical protein